jgi:outer membrane immunogenic protein
LSCEKALSLKTKFLAAATLCAFANSATAADFPGPLTAPVRAFISSPVWSGAFLGVQAGYAWASTPLGLYAVAPPNIAFDDIDPKGLTYGVNAGYNLQFGGLVMGVVADADLNSVNKAKNGVTAGSVFIPAPEKVNVRWQASLRGRVGYAILSDLLLYATGGVAFSNLEVVTTFPAPGSNSETVKGWTVGGGVAYALTRSLSASVEYRYTSFGAFERPMAAPFIARTQMDSQVVRAGLSYRLGG